MDEPKARKPRSDKGVPKGSRVSSGSPEQSAPIFVRIVLRGLGFDQPLSFGCARHEVVNGFHVFFYPSLYDRYRESRREFAISEIVDIEITEARAVYEFREMTKVVNSPEPIQTRIVPLEDEPPGKMKIHSVRRNLSDKGMGNDVVSRLETAQGPIKMTEADLSGALGVGADVKGIGDSNV